MSAMRVVLVVCALGSPAFAQESTPGPPPAPAPDEPKPTWAEPAPTPPPPVAAPAQPLRPATIAAIEKEEWSAASGFALEVRIETGQTVFDNSNAGGTVDTLPTTQAGVFAGHRSELLTVGVGIDLSSLRVSQQDPSFSAGQRATTLVILPGVRVTVLRSGDRRTELLAQLDVGVGATWFSTSGSTGNPDPESISRARAQIGPALRYWVGRSFAVGGTGGLRYDRASRPSGDFQASSLVATTGIYGSLQLLGVF